MLLNFKLIVQFLLASIFIANICAAYDCPGGFLSWRKLHPCKVEKCPNGSEWSKYCTETMNGADPMKRSGCNANTYEEYSSDDCAGNINTSFKYKCCL